MQEDNRERGTAHRHSSAERHGKGAKTGRKAPLRRIPNIRWLDGAAGGAGGRAAAAEEQQQEEALVRIEMRKLNHFITKPFTNGFCVLEFSKLKMYMNYIVGFRALCLRFHARHSQNYLKLFATAQNCQKLPKLFLQKLIFKIILFSIKIN